jgi:hypothetical protein
MRRPRNLLLCLAALTLGAIAGVGLSGASFSAQKANPANTFTAATSFCTSPGLQSVTADRDTYVDQNSPTTATGGTASTMSILTKGNKNQRVLVGFTLPTKPSGCSVTLAKLKLTATTPSDAGRTIEAYQISPSATWNETTVTWSGTNGQPAITGSPATTTSSATGLQTWTVTSLVQGMYGSANANNGFLLKDQVEDSSPSKSQTYSTRDASSNKPTLEVTFG